MKVESERILRVPVPPVLDMDGEVRVRTGGLHLSSIIRHIAVKGGLLKPETYKFVGREVVVKAEDEWEWELAKEAGHKKSKGKEKGKLVELIPLRWAIGCAWEEWIARTMPHMIWQPGELKRDGIAMSPDGLTPRSGGQVVVEEFKCTYKSSLVQGAPRDIQMEWMWMSQCKGYGGALETGEARLHVLYVNGGYRFDDEVPEYWRYRLHFTEQDLEANWKMMMRHKGAVMKAEGIK